MRGKLMLGVLGLVMLGACGGDKGAQVADTGSAPPTPPAVAKKSVVVDINVQCVTEDSTWVKIDPWVANLKKNGKDDIEFTVNAASNATAVEITLKDAAAPWPLVGRPPYTVKKGGNGKKDLGATQPNDSTRYRYNVVATCNINGKTRKLVVDPDIFVD